MRLSQKPNARKSKPAQTAAWMFAMMPFFGGGVSGFSPIGQQVTPTGYYPQRDFSAQTQPASPQVQQLELNIASILNPQASASPFAGTVTGDQPQPFGGPAFATDFKEKFGHLIGIAPKPAAVTPPAVASSAE